MFKIQRVYCLYGGPFRTHQTRQAKLLKAGCSLWNVCCVVTKTATWPETRREICSGWWSESGHVLFPRGPNMTRSTERIQEDPAGAVCVWWALGLGWIASEATVSCEVSADPVRASRMFESSAQLSNIRQVRVHFRVFWGSGTDFWTSS